MPDLAGAKSISICQIAPDGELARICDWMEPSTVRRICSGIVASEVRPGTKAHIEPGPLLVILDAAGKPLIAFMQRLDGWLSAFTVDHKNEHWTFGKSLMDRDEYRRATAAYPCWDLVYQIWLHTVNPELYKAGQQGAGQPATRSESKPDDGDNPQHEAEGRSR